MDTDSYSLLIALKGARLHVLVAIRLFLRPVTESALSTLTGYSRQTCALALRDLTGLGYVEQRHYRGWQLSTTALQLPLWTEGELEGAADQLLLDEPEPAAPHALAAATRVSAAVSATVEKPDTQPGLFDCVKTDAGAMLSVRKPDAQEPSVRKPDTQELSVRKPNFQAPCGGCCLRTVNTLNKVREQQPTVNVRKPNTQEPSVRKPDSSAPAVAVIVKNARIVKNVKTPAAAPACAAAHPPAAAPRSAAPARPLPPADAAIVDDLIQLTGCPRPRALAAVSAARAAGRSAAYLHREVLYWHAYIASPRGRTILNPGYFVASRLEAGIPCPFAEVAFRHQAKLAAFNSLLNAPSSVAQERPSVGVETTCAGPDADLLPPDPAPPPDPDRALMDSLRSHLQLQLPRTSYETWVRDAWFSRADGRLLVYHANDYARDWLSKRLLPLITRTAASLFGVAPGELTVQVLAQSPLAEVTL